METLREFLKGWMGKGLLILFMLPLVITGFESIVRSGDDPNAVAKVGEQNIDSATLQNQISARRQALLEQVGGDTSLIREPVLRDQVLQSMVERYLLIHQSNQLGFTVSDATITQMLATEKTFLDSNGKFSNDLFGDFLRQRGMTKDQLFDSLRQDMVVSAFSRGIINTAVFPNASVDKLIGQQSQMRPLSVARIAWQPFASQVQITDTEIANFYNQNKATLISPEQVDLSYLVVDKNALNVPAPTAQEIEQQYQTYLNNNGQQTEYDLAMILMSSNNAQTTLASLKQKLDSNPAEFANLAKQYSEDAGSKDNGGNIGTISKDMFPNEYSQIMSAVKSLQVGQVTAPIKTSYGYHLFKLNKINGATPPTLDSIKSILIEQASQQKRDTQYQELIGKINNDAATGASIAEIANRYHLAVQTLNNYGKTDNTSALTQPAVITAVFDPVTLQEGSVSVGVDLKGKTVWVQPKNHRPSQPLSQAEAVPVIKARLTEKKAKDLALAQANAIATQIKQTNNLTSAKVPFQNLGNVSRQSPNLLPEERSVAFSVPASANAPAVITQATSQGASVLIGGAITQDNSQLSPELRAQTARIIRENIGQSQFEDYLAYLREIVPVNIKPVDAPTTTP